MIKILKFCISSLLSLSMLLSMFNFSAYAASVSDLEYKTENGEIIITGCDSLTKGTLVIPAKINGKKVTRIDDGVFSICDELTSIELPSTITEIGDRAFYSMNSLKKLF